MKTYCEQTFTLRRHIDAQFRPIFHSLPESIRKVNKLNVDYHTITVDSESMTIGKDTARSCFENSCHPLTSPGSTVSNANRTNIQSVTAPLTNFTLSVLRSHFALTCTLERPVLGLRIIVLHPLSRALILVEVRWMVWTIQKPVLAAVDGLGKAWSVHVPVMLMCA